MSAGLTAFSVPELTGRRHCGGGLLLCLVRFSTYSRRAFIGFSLACHGLAAGFLMVLLPVFAGRLARRWSSFRSLRRLGFPGSGLSRELGCATPPVRALRFSSARWVSCSLVSTERSRLRKARSAVVWLSFGCRFGSSDRAVKVGDQAWSRDAGGGYAAADWVKAAVWSALAQSIVPFRRCWLAPQAACAFRPTEVAPQEKVRAAAIPPQGLCRASAGSQPVVSRDSAWWWRRLTGHDLARHCEALLPFARTQALLEARVFLATATSRR